MKIKRKSPQLGHCYVGSKKSSRQKERISGRLLLVNQAVAIVDIPSPTLRCKLGV